MLKDASTSDEGKKARILIVNDDPEMAESFRFALEDSGLFQVRKYTDPFLALSNLKRGDYNLVLLDIKMPNINSFDLYDKMKMIDSTLKVCFIGPYDNEDSYQALKNEFPSLETECFMSKPVRTEDLIKRIIRILS
jgi:DNA-binding NtrC family response regulator